MTAADRKDARDRLADALQASDDIAAPQVYLTREDAGLILTRVA